MKPYRSIVLTVCEKHGVTAEAFFGRTRTPEMAKVRCAAVLALRQAGFSFSEIARLVKRNLSTVQYWLCPNQREARICRRKGIPYVRPTKTSGIQTKTVGQDHVVDLYATGWRYAGRSDEGLCVMVKRCPTVAAVPHDLSAS